MPSPTMLPRDRNVASRPAAPSAASTLVVALLVVICAGLVVAGFLAVYSWNVSPAVGPIVAVLAALFGAVLLLLIAAPLARRRSR